MDITKIKSGIIYYTIRPHGDHSWIGKRQRKHGAIGQRRHKLQDSILQAKFFTTFENAEKYLQKLDAEAVNWYSIYKVTIFLEPVSEKEDVK